MTENGRRENVGTLSASRSNHGLGGSVSGWARTFWVGVVLIVPGGFLLFLSYAFARTLLNRKRAAAQANGGEAHLRDVLAEMRLKDLLREVRAAI
jgi:hypothetical protein